MGARDARHVVAERADNVLDIHRDDGLVLDDEDIGRNLLSDFAACLRHQAVELFLTHIEDGGGFFIGEVLDREKKERLACRRRYAVEFAVYIVVKNSAFRPLTIDPE